MQAPQQESVNMRAESAMDMKPAEAAVKQALQLQIPAQDAMDAHHLPNMCSFDFERFANCEGCHAMPDEDTRDQSAVKVEHLQVACANCCQIASCYCKFPECLGSTCDGTCIFSQGKCTMCKPLDCKDEDKRCCAIMELNGFLKIPTECIEMKSQCCCLDGRMAVPCNDEVPCIYTPIPFCVCCADFGFKIACCPTVGDIIPRLKQ